MRDDTIIAVASGAGRAGVAVIRISGAAAGDVLVHLGGRGLPPARRARLQDFLDPHTGTVIDQGLALWFPAPRSFTGEDVVELHIHGGRAVIAAIIAAATRLPDCRLAEPGEFSRRAFQHGKFDLTQAEGLADLVNAETEAQRRQALRQLDGELGALYESWRRELLGCLAHAEADIDFVEEELPSDLAAGIASRVRALIAPIRGHLNDRRIGERTRDGLYAAIVGAPNVGKSSLLNRLAGRDAAIVSSTAGTTRDVIEVRLDIAGYPVTVADTAGLREARDAIEGEGVRRARARAEQADLMIAVFDAQTWPERDAATLALMDERTLSVVNKADKVGPRATDQACVVSALTGEGMAEFFRELERRVDTLMTGRGPGVPLTQMRHRLALGECCAALERSLAAPAAELQAEDLRLAARALGRITGRVDVEEILDVVFREFCIGK
ncbi:MAG: tRNA uridine-5-carboxymethylaminomethyl(34) synthesis GTPase MnmE [Alphaproteobacteria bacterium]|nr:tRNA uridine-5-carboxymethylaminomethyl(34) synthesis GTPase MnmE [Alphaproteobacteria bacterium]